MLVIGVLERLELNERWKAEIERAQAILELEDDWDGEGSPPYSRTTLDRAIAFVTSYGRRLWEMHGMQLPIPKIGPGPDASIDLHWKQTSRELLVNIPADANQLSVFYGDNYGTQSIKGSIDLDDFNLVLAQWLTN